MKKIVLLGDSIIEYMPYQFNGKIGNEENRVLYYGVENIGVGNFMYNIWPHVTKENVDTYILLIGINNIGRPNCDNDNKESIEDIIVKIKEFINIITSTTDSNLIVQSIYPTKYKNYIESIKYINSCIQMYCDNKKIEYLDIYPLLVTEEETLNKKYSTDGLHPNSLGYQVIADEINKLLTVKQIEKRLNLVNQ